VPDGVLDDIGDGCVIFVRVLDHLRPVAAAEEVVDASVTLVEGAGVAAVQVAHALVEVRLWSLDDQVEVIPHDAADMHAPAVAPRDSAEEVEEQGAVLVVEDDRHVVVAAGDHVVHGTGFEMAP
jgi:hypothetical protein